jgi:alkaline phosphatase
MIEGAKVDKGGHANDLYTVVDEYLSFDRLVGKALEYADQNGETLILVLSDHETGGLTLLDGDYKTGTVTGNFFTNDHTGIPTLLYAYGPCSQYFCGFAENSSLFDKILGFYK